MRPISALPLLCGACWVAMAGAATAATVSVGPADAIAYGPRVIFDAAPGERNAVRYTVEVAPDFLGRTSWTVTDDQAPVTAGEGCVQLDGHSARCDASGPQASFSFADVRLGDGDDRFGPSSTGSFGGGIVATGGDGDDEIVGTGFTHGLLSGDAGDDVLRSGSIPAIPSSLHGGPGNDRLFGGAGGDQLDGGGGIDELHGGPGPDQLSDGDDAAGAGPDADLLDGGPNEGGTGGDVLSYRPRKAPVSVDLIRATGGERGEDDVLRSIDWIIGGAADDSRAGHDGQNTLEGGGGADRLSGRGGDDILSQAGGTVRCGTGQDQVVSARSTRDYLLPDCELMLQWPYESAQRPAYPWFAGASLRYRIACPYNDDEFQDHRVRCSGGVRLREASGRGRLLAAGRFPKGRWSARVVRLRLTAHGRRLAAEGRRTRVAIVVEGVAPEPLRWSIRMRLRPVRG